MSLGNFVTFITLFFKCYLHISTFKPNGLPLDVYLMYLLQKEEHNFYGNKHHSTDTVTLFKILTQKCPSQDKHIVHEFAAEAHEDVTNHRRKERYFKMSICVISKQHVLTT